MQKFIETGLNRIEKQHRIRNERAQIVILNQVTEISSESNEIQQISYLVMHIFQELVTMILCFTIKILTTDIFVDFLQNTIEQLASRNKIKAPLEMQPGLIRINLNEISHGHLKPI